MSRPATAVQREAAFPVCPVLLSGGMQVVKLHDDEVDVDEGLVRRLLAAQAPGGPTFPFGWLSRPVRTM